MSATDDGAGGVRFVIVAARRSGSNLLCSLLDSHPAILCHHEIFNPAGIFYSLSLRDGDFDLGSVAERDAAPIAFLDRVFGHPRGHRCVGFKMTEGQAEPVLEHVLADPAVKKIVLLRRNRVKTCISEVLAERLGQWEVYDEADLASERPPVVIDVQDLRRRIARNEAFHRHVDAVLGRTGQACLRVRYEALERPDEQAALLDFLHARPNDIGLRSRSVKQNPRDARALVENFDELAAALRGDPLLDELLDPED